MKIETSNMVIVLAQACFDYFEQQDIRWDKAFFRYYADDSRASSSSSFIVGSQVELVGTIREKNWFRVMNSLFAQVRQLTPVGDDKFCVALLTIDSDFSYKIEFEYIDGDKWEINKMYGGTGLPSV